MRIKQHATLLAGLALISGSTVAGLAATKMGPGPLNFTVTNIDGKRVGLKKYAGDVVMIVNTASLCGNTPQYASLEKLYKTYKSKGFRILAFPENNFMNQEPGNNASIKTFCTGKYKTSFDLFSKISVKGPDKAPLYTYLTDKSTDPKFGGDIEWNFAKFLIGRDGEIVGRFPAGHDPLSADVVSAIQTQLSAASKRK